MSDENRMTSNENEREIDRILNRNKMIWDRTAGTSLN